MGLIYDDPTLAALMLTRIAAEESEGPSELTVRMHTVLDDLVHRNGREYLAELVIVLARVRFIAFDDLARSAGTSTAQLLDEAEVEALEGLDGGLEHTAMTNTEPPDEIPPNGMSAVERASIEKQSNEDRERSVSRLSHDTSGPQAVTVARYEIHEPKAVQWDVIATLVAWAAALGAALGGVSIIADQLLLASVLAIATAALSTFLAAAKP